MKADVKKISLLVLAVGSVLTITLGVNSYLETKPKNGYQLERKEAGEGTVKEELYAIDQQGEKIPVEITIEEERLTEREAKEMLEQATTVLEEYLRGSNSSLTQVTENLNFIKKIPGTPVGVEWQTDAWEYFQGDLTLRTDIVLTEPVEVAVRAILTCQGWNSLYETTVILVPRDETVQQRLENFTNQKLSENAEEKEALLPEQFEGQELFWRRKMDWSFLAFPIFSGSAAAALWIGQKRDLEQEKKKRKEALDRDYAELVSKFTMLLMAGMSVRNAWERIVQLERKHRNKKKSKLIYEEMEISVQQFQKGFADAQVLEEFGVRTGVLHYKKLMSLFVINQKRGSKNLLQLLETEMLDAWEERKRNARMEGEIVGTKLMLPMMGMLAVVFVMILVPAFLSF